MIEEYLQYHTAFGFEFSSRHQEDKGHVSPWPQTPNLFLHLAINGMIDMYKLKRHILEYIHARCNIEIDSYGNLPLER